MSSRKPLQCPRCGSTSAEFTATQARHGEQSYIVTMGDNGLLLEPVSYDIYDIRRTLMLGWAKNGGSLRTTVRTKGDGAT